MSKTRCKQCKTMNTISDLYYAKVSGENLCYYCFIDYLLKHEPNSNYLKNTEFMQKYNKRVCA